MTKENQRKHEELKKMETRGVIIRIDPKTKDEYLSGHCLCPNTWHKVEIKDGIYYFGCQKCGCEAGWKDGKWTSGHMSPEGFLTDREIDSLLR